MSDEQLPAMLGALQEREKVKKAKDILAKMNTGEGVPPGYARCACLKIVPLEVVHVLDTGVFKLHSDICKGCVEKEKLDRELARLVCVRCRSLIGRVQPQRAKDGFEYKPNRTYHLESCPSCAETEDEKQESRIIERVRYMQQQGKKL